MAEQEIELNFRLDGNGRTALPPQQLKNSGVLSQAAPLQYETRTVQASFVSPNNNDDDNDDNDNKPCSFSCLDDLLLDCEIADSGLMPRTFWMPADGKPRFALEQMALNVFEHHVVSRMSEGDCKDADDAENALVYDPKLSGAEWWVQLRPSPEKAGRYAMHVHDNKDKDDNDDDNEHRDLSKTGISFHWDKDEDLRILCGGNTYLHAHISTVTYLTGLGAPTLAMNCRVHPLTGEWIVPPPQHYQCDSASKTASSKEKDAADDDDDDLQAFVSWPLAGKHLSFDGRYLHAAPTDLMEDGAFDEQCKFVANNNSTNDNTENRKMQRRHRRVTFLVNIWINYKPFNVDPFPDTMVDKMSGNGDAEFTRISFHDKKDAGATIPTKKVEIVDGQVASSDDTTTTTSAKQFAWPMGGCDSGETIRMQIPLKEVREEAKRGGNVHITYASSGKGEPGVVLEKLEETGQSQPKKQKTVRDEP